MAGRAGDVSEHSGKPYSDLVDMWETVAQQARRLAASLKLQAAWFLRQ